MQRQRKIIHVDMDAFYASIEMRDDPDLQNKPLVISRNPQHTNGHGVVATANYIARSYGIHSAMSAQEALKKCPTAYFKKPDFPKYKKVSHQIHQIFHEYTDKIEPVAFDEAYLDVTDNFKQFKSSVSLAHRIQQEIYDQLHLTCSTGVSYNKFLAKLASDYHKPVGMTIINEEDVLDFLFPLPIEKFRGIGKKTAPRMRNLGINTGKDLYQWKEIDLISHFGKMGHILYQRVRGIDNRPVEWQRERKSIGSQRTFDQPLNSIEQVDEQLKLTAQRLVHELNRQQKHGKTLVIKVRDSHFETLTKRLSFDDDLDNQVDAFVYYGRKLFDEIQNDLIDVRLLGLTITNLDPLDYENIRLDL